MCTGRHGSGVTTASSRPSRAARHRRARRSAEQEQRDRYVRGRGVGVGWRPGTPSTYSRSSMRTGAKTAGPRRTPRPPAERSRGRGPAAEHDAATIARIDGAHAQAPVNVAPHRLDLVPRTRRSTAARPGAPAAPAPDRRADPGGDRSGTDEENRHLSPGRIRLRERGPAHPPEDRPGGRTGLADPGRRGERPATTSPRRSSRARSRRSAGSHACRRRSRPRIRPGRQ